MKFYCLRLFLIVILPIVSFAQSNTFPSSGNVGIGTTNPLTKLHVYNGSSGRVPHGFSDFSIEDDEHVMLTLMTYNTKYAYYGFADTDDDFVGGIQYNHSNDMMYFRVNNRSADMVINKDGEVGIGTASPQHKLHVEGTINGVLRHKSSYFLMLPYSSSYDDGSYAKTFYDGNRKQIRFWNSDTNTNFTRLETGGLTIGSSNPISSTNGFENRIEFINGGHGAIVFHPGGSDELMFGMHSNGNFYWGTGQSADNPNYYPMYLNSSNGDLGIRGRLTANEVKVKIGGWADYVFNEDYDLPTLDEVEEHIKKEGHLINIPSAKEVEKNGVQLGEMNKLLLEKIEEMTLYIIALEKKNKIYEDRLTRIEVTLKKIRK